MDYVFHILIIISIYAVLAGSLELLVGHTGLVSISHAAYYGLGAYLAAIVTLRLGLPLLFTVPMAMAGTAVLAMLVSRPLCRLREDSFALGTLCVQQIFSCVWRNWTGVTGGPMGISGIPQPVLLGERLASNLPFLFLASTVAAASMLVFWRVGVSPFGRVLRAIRDDEVFAVSLGKKTVRAKYSVLVLSAAFAGLAGSLFAYYLSFIDPTSFTLDESVLILAMVIIGGAGAFRGAVLGAALLVLLPEALRFLGLPSGAAGNIRQIVYGAVLILVLALRPRGLVGTISLSR